MQNFEIIFKIEIFIRTIINISYLLINFMTLLLLFTSKYITFLVDIHKTRTFLHKYYQWSDLTMTTFYSELLHWVLVFALSIIWKQRHLREILSSSNLLLNRFSSLLYRTSTVTIVSSLFNRNISAALLYRVILGGVAKNTKSGIQSAHPSLLI